MTLKYEMLIIAALVAATLVATDALEGGTVDLAQLAQIMLRSG